MNSSASEPAFDYKLPAHGIGDTGLGPRVLLGTQLKDTGKHSSRINCIIRQAEKVPGPGKYVAHEDWAQNGGNKFANVSRDYKPHHKGPASSHYEVKDIAMNHSIGAKDSLSKNHRTLHGKVPKGKKRSFLDQAEYHGKHSCPPGAGTYEPSKFTTLCDRMEGKVNCGPSWAASVGKSKSMKPKVSEPGPNHYNLDWKHLEGREPNYSCPKDKDANFITKAVGERMVDRRKNIPLPGPGTYNNHTMDDSKVSRGTYHLQLRGLTRSSMSGYF